MDRVKVCHIITKLELGGAQQNTLYTVNHLNSEKFEALLVCGSGGLLDKETESLKQVKTVFLPSLIRSANPFNDLFSLIKLYRILKSEKPHIVHTHSSKAGILGHWAAYFAGVPVIIHTFHGFGFHDFQSWPVKTLFVLIEKVTALISHKLIVVAKDNIDKALKHGIGRKEQYMVIRSGIETKKFASANFDKTALKASLGIPQNSSVVTTIGPFKPQKNLKDFIAAASLVSSKRPGTVFLVIGDGKQRAELESLISALKLKDAIKLLGWRRDIAELLSVSDIFVLTSLWEGLPRSVLEAMSSALPVVANSVDGTREIVKDCESGYLVEPKNPDKTAEKILELLENPELRSKMGAFGRELITTEYDIDFMVRQQEELYSELLSASHS